MEVERIIFPFGEKRERRRARPGFMFSKRGNKFVFYETSRMRNFCVIYAHFGVTDIDDINFLQTCRNIEFRPILVNLL